MKRTYCPGDFVACYLSNSAVHEELLVWGMVIDVSPTLEDILVLDRTGDAHWWPSRRWRPLTKEKEKHLDIFGYLA